MLLIASGLAVFLWDKMMAITLTTCVIGGLLVCYGGVKGLKAKVLSLFYRGEQIDVHSLINTRRGLMALSLVPVFLDILGLRSLFMLAGDTGSWGLLLTMFASSAIYSVSALGQKAKLRGLDSLKMAWYASLLCYPIICWCYDHDWCHWSWEVARKACSSLLFAAAAMKLANVPPSVVANSARYGLVLSLEDTFGSLGEELTSDAMLQLALVRWVVEFWNQPGDFSWAEMQAMLLQALESIKSEALDARVLPAIDGLMNKVSHLDIDAEAEPLVKSVRDAIKAVPPSPGSSAWLLAIKACPCFLTATATIMTAPFGIIPLLPCIWVELYDLLQLQTAIREARSRAMERPEEDGLCFLLDRSNSLLAGVWRNTHFAVVCMESGLSVMRVYQTSSSTVKLVQDVRTLAQVGAQIKEQGLAYGAEWLLKEGMSLSNGARDGSSGLLSGMMREVAIISRHAQVLWSHHGDEAQGVIKASQQAITGAVVGTANNMTHVVGSAAGSVGTAVSYAADSAGRLLHWGGHNDDDLLREGISSASASEAQLPEVESDNYSQVQTGDSEEEKGEEKEADVAELADSAVRRNLCSREEANRLLALEDKDTVVKQFQLLDKFHSSDRPDENEADSSSSQSGNGNNTSSKSDDGNLIGMAIGIGSGVLIGASTLIALGSKVREKKASASRQGVQSS
ncbi:unnamed protein product [Chrysoparadoxa australica]